MPTLRQGVMLGLLIALITLAACQVVPAPPTATSPPPTSTAINVAGTLSTVPTTEDAVPRITAEDLQAKLAAGQEVVVVDTRSLENYHEKRIAGAISMPLVEVDLRYQELPKDKEIVFYCT